MGIVFRRDRLGGAAIAGKMLRRRIETRDMRRPACLDTVRRCAVRLRPVCLRRTSQKVFQGVAVCMVRSKSRVRVLVVVRGRMLLCGREALCSLAERIKGRGVIGSVLSAGSRVHVFRMPISSVRHRNDARKLTKFQVKAVKNAKLEVTAGDGNCEGKSKRRIRKRPLSDLTQIEVEGLKHLRQITVSA